MSQPVEDDWLICAECGAWFERPTNYQPPKTCGAACAGNRRDWQNKLRAAGVSPSPDAAPVKDR